MRLPNLPLLKTMLLNRPMSTILPPPSLVMTLLSIPEPDTCEEISSSFLVARHVLGFFFFFFFFFKSNFRTI